MSPAASQFQTQGETGPEIDSRLVQVAFKALHAGEVVAIPTDTVYGLAAAIDQSEAIARLYKMKDRPSEKAIPVLLSDPGQVLQVATGLSPVAQRLASFFWPGAVTLVLPARPHLPSHLTSRTEDGLRTVAVRVPDHPLARAIIRAAGGALAVTSANRSGDKPALEAGEVNELRGLPPILVIDGGRVSAGIASTVILATSAAPLILREGAISASAIAAALEIDDAIAGDEARAGYDQPMTGQLRQTAVTDTPA